MLFVSRDPSQPLCEHDVMRATLPLSRCHVCQIERAPEALQEIVQRGGLRPKGTVFSFPGDNRKRGRRPHDP